MALAAKITVTLDDDGKINLTATGPAADNHVLLLGLLEFGKAALLNQQPEPAGPGLVLPMGPLPRNGR